MAPNKPPSSERPPLSHSKERRRKTTNNRRQARALAPSPSPSPSSLVPAPASVPLSTTPAVPPSPLGTPTITINREMTEGKRKLMQLSPLAGLIPRETEKPENEKETSFKTENKSTPALKKRRAKRLGTGETLTPTPTLGAEESVARISGKKESKSPGKMSVKLSAKATRGEDINETKAALEPSCEKKAGKANGKLKSRKESSGRGGLVSGKISGEKRAKPLPSASVQTPLKPTKKSKKPPSITSADTVEKRDRKSSASSGPEINEKDDNDNIAAKDDAVDVSGYDSDNVQVDDVGQSEGDTEVAAAKPATQQTKPSQKKLSVPFSRPRSRNRGTGELLRTKKSGRKGNVNINSDESSEGSSVIYVGHVPHGFYEREMRGYFSQYGTVNRVKLSRSKRTARSKGYAFIEFEDTEVARLAAESMDGYLMHGRALVAKVVSKARLHPDTFKGAERTFKRIAWAAVSRHQMEKAAAVPKRIAARSKKIEKKYKAKQARLERLNINYKFPQVPSA